MSAQVLLVDFYAFSMLESMMEKMRIAIYVEVPKVYSCSSLIRLIFRLFENDDAYIRMQEDELNQKSEN